MADPIVFTASQRAIVREMRGRGLSWDRIGERLGVSRSRAYVEGVSLGLALPLHLVRGGVSGVKEVRDVPGGEALPVWHPIARAVLAEAGLPVPPVGGFW